MGIHRENVDTVHVLPVTVMSVGLLFQAECERRLFEICWDDTSCDLGEFKSLLSQPGVDPNTHDQVVTIPHYSVSCPATDSWRCRCVK